MLDMYHVYVLQYHPFVDQQAHSKYINTQKILVKMDFKRQSEGQGRVNREGRGISKEMILTWTGKPSPSNALGDVISHTDDASIFAGDQTPKITLLTCDIFNENTSNTDEK